MIHIKSWKAINVLGTYNRGGTFTERALARSTLPRQSGNAYAYSLLDLEMSPNPAYLQMGTKEGGLPVRDLLPNRQPTGQRQVGERTLKFEEGIIIKISS